MREPIVNMKAILTEQQLTVLRLKYVDGLTQQEIAGMVGLDQSTVSRLIAAAMGRLREEKNIILDLSA